MHMCTDGCTKKKKITSDYSMKPAAATRVTTLALLQGLQRNNQNAVKQKRGELTESSYRTSDDFVLVPRRKHGADNVSSK